MDYMRDYMRDFMREEEVSTIVDAFVSKPAFISGSIITHCWRTYLIFVVSCNDSKLHDS